MRLRESKVRSCRGNIRKNGIGDILVSKSFFKPCVGLQDTLSKSVNKFLRHRSK